MAGITAEVKLPSNGLICEKVKIRSMLGKDERHLAELSESNVERKVADMLGGLITGVNVMDLTVRDEMALLIWVAVNTYEPEYPVRGPCKWCYHALKFNADLTKFEVDYLPTGFRDPVQVTLSDGAAVGIRLTRVRDVVATEDFSKVSKDGTWLFSHAVTVCNGKSVPENLMWLGELPSKDLALIRAVQEKTRHGVRMMAPYTCPECGGTGEMPVPFRLDMVFPTGSDLERIS